MQTDNHTIKTDRKPNMLRKRLGAIGALLLTATLLSGCYVGPAGCWHCGGGGGWHHDHWR